ncbi:hypothetical protein FOL47_000742 [Perkinsus chesapeaki]|uniref:Peptide transporter ptr2 n=1 Tax=Perkinsus chesapeaki TaxID=330153 RepID=A0A7J6KUG1_PERCH|nr:hypothetical protein FOL47_000742 [Perkinsus chesapeaki]
MVKSSRSISWTDPSGNIYHYYENPMFRAVVFVLLQELCERLAFYGLTPNLQTFLKEYLGYTDTTANSYISAFNAILYVTPLFSAALADTILGVYLTIIIFSLVYLCGFTLLTISSIRSVHQAWMIHISLLVLIPLGGGGIKSCVNIMGAHQFHPELHKPLITRYYTYFYASINLGAIVGGIVTPILLQEVSFTASFLFPLIFFIIATVIFVAGGLLGRYVMPKPQGSAVVQILKVMFWSVMKLSLEKNKESNGGKYKDGFIEDVKALLRLIPLFSLIIPFVMAYNNMTTAFLTQAQKMDRTTGGWQIPPAMMQNVDPIAVVVTSLFVDGVVYRLLRKHNKMPPVLGRFCIGCGFGALALLCALIVELQVKSHPVFTVSIWWQVPQFWFIATGEIFLISTSYEIAFTHSPSSLKTVASAVNLCFFAIASALSAVLFDVAQPWLPNFVPSNPTEETVAGAHYDYYYIVLIGLCVFGGLASLSLIPYFNKVARKNAVRQAEADKERREESVEQSDENVKS